MAKCELNISLDKTTYKGGETLRGILHVEVDKQCDCHSLSVKEIWEIHGKSDRVSIHAEEEILFRGTWQPGSYSYPFEITLDYGPLTHEGHHINIDCFLQATADIPWAIDPETKTSITLLQGEFSEERKEAALVEYKKNLDAPGDLKKLIPLIVVIFAVIGVFFILAKQEYEFGALLLTSGLGLFYYHMLARLAELKTGAINCTLSEYVPYPGDSLRCQVSFTPRSHININEVTATLIGREMIVRGSGKDTRVYTHQIYEKQLTLIQEREVDAGLFVSGKTNIEIPEGTTACSLAVFQNNIIWEIKITIDIDKWHDWVKIEPITVIS